MAGVVEGTMVRFIGFTEVPVKPYEFLSEMGAFIRPNEQDEANLNLVISRIGYGLVVARVCLLESQRAERLICVGDVEYEAKPFVRKSTALSVAKMFNDLSK